MKRLLVFGAGYSAKAAASVCASVFDQISGTTRSPDKLPALAAASMDPLIFNGASTAELETAIASATHLLVSAAPDKQGDPVLSVLHESLAQAPALRWVGYLSTVGVYGDHGGAWVNEESECRPVSARSIERLQAEGQWMEFCERKRIPLSILRLSGIYGPGRNALVNIEKGTSRRLVKPGQVFNRIHRDDIAMAVRLAVEVEAGGIFNITDDEPAPPQEVVEFAHALVGTKPPVEQDFATAQLSEMARSFYGENKRVSNLKSRKVLGLAYRYPNYREALTRMWTENSWR
ncbi:MAG: SDR family oxidoreductase [Rhizobiaceae bacterium]